MKREIKFRAFWDDGKTMKYSDDHRNSGAFLDIAQGDLLVFGPNSVHIMQYTGLKDKDKVEIWEDDVVEAIMNFHGQETDTKFNAKIIYNSHIGAFQISYKNMHDHFVSDAISGRYFLKVIGNIYENPELLK